MSICVSEYVCVSEFGMINCKEFVCIRGLCICVCMCVCFNRCEFNR